MYHTKLFKGIFYGTNAADQRIEEIDLWLNRFKRPYVVGYVSYSTDVLITIVDRPDTYDKPQISPANTTIDEIPEIPTIHQD